MKRAVLVLNVLSVAFTLFVTATDGLPTRPIYVVFALMLVGVPVLTVFVLARGGDGAPARLAALLNLVLLGAVVLAVVDQHPHPDEPGFLPYLALVALTPVLSVVALLRR